MLYPAKALDPIKPALLTPEVTDASKWWESKHQYMDPEGSHIFVFVGSVDMPNVFYNKHLVDPTEFKSYWISSKENGAAKSSQSTHASLAGRGSARAFCTIFPNSATNS